MPIFDVRSPSEYANGHVPGAVSVPLFSDEERAEIGTVYKQKSEAKALRLGLKYAGLRMADLVAQVDAIAKRDPSPVEVYCWRGGQRSGSVSWLLRTAGYEVLQWPGGYKSYRHAVLESWASPRPYVVLAGLTGTGKTELVLLAARYLFGEDRVRRFDLSEYQRTDAVERLLGADASDAGAVGRAAVGATPRVWLFDELEKAHPKVLDLFIQMLEPGHITLASGEVVSLKNDYIAFTSNIGASEAMRMARSGMASIEQAVLRRVAEALRPEILARVPDKLVFARLAPDVQREIAGLHLANEVARLKSVGFDLEVSSEALEF